MEKSIYSDLCTVFKLIEKALQAIGLRAPPHEGLFTLYRHDAQEVGTLRLQTQRLLSSDIFFQGTPGIPLTPYV